MPTAVTLEEVVAYVSLGSSALLAGRLLFSTESGVKNCEKVQSQHDSQLAALLSSASDTKAAHAALVERVNSMNASMEGKASIESVSAVRDAVESLRREQEAANRSVIQHLERIESKVDRRS